jgi:hypothetical protein
MAAGRDPVRGPGPADASVRHWQEGYPGLDARQLRWFVGGATRQAGTFKSVPRKQSRVVRIAAKQPAVSGQTQCAVKFVATVAAARSVTSRLHCCHGKGSTGVCDQRSVS